MILNRHFTSLDTAAAGPLAVVPATAALALLGSATIGTDRAALLLAILLAVAAGAFQFARHLVNVHADAYYRYTQTIELRARLLSATWYVTPER
jgi:hypothetical protein